MRDLCCGLNAVIERKATVTLNSEVTIHAIVTNVVQHNKTSKGSADSLSNGDVKRHKEIVNSTETSRKRSQGRKRKYKY